MAKSIREIRKYERKARPTAAGTPVLTRIQPDLLGKLDKWCEKQNDLPSRPEAIRRLVEQALAGKPAGGREMGAKRSEVASAAGPPASGAGKAKRAEEGGRSS